MTTSPRHGAKIGRRASPFTTLLLLVAVGAPSGCHKKAAEEDENKPAVEVRCVAAARVALEETLTLRGRTATPPGGDLPMASQIAGRITESRVHEGDHLARGAVIATVDDLAPRAAATGAGAASSPRAASSGRTPSPTW